MELSDEQRNVLNKVLKNLHNIKTSNDLEFIDSDDSEWEEDSGGTRKSHHRIISTDIYISITETVDSYNSHETTGIEFVKPKIITITEFE